MRARPLGSSSRRSGRSEKYEHPFLAERLAFSDGTVIFGSNYAPIFPLAKTVQEFTAARDVHESLAALDKFEQLHPTLPGDEEEAEAAAESNRAAALRSLIPLLDTNEDGFIDRSEMQRAMPSATDEDLLSTMQACDLDGDGKVSADEWMAHILKEQAYCDDIAFVEAISRLCEVLKAPMKNATKALFSASDLDGSGTLDMYEVATILGRQVVSGNKLLQLKEVMEDFDKDKNGEIDYEEFVELFERLIEERIVARPRHK
uniref:EF-hand domain-containing protein n=1 Tax=Haptolina brevifila TaxID=156173 RepID=A0A7S2BW90_9EUKA|mmetsp:Transcript_17221/g.34835  ORF Transcript_17221/g.34835 Transcript_17221/m.34835 type:complete len:260 (+) Transcript_17221:91-870(+)|eukprot:CAMPEP_0174719908 /NCGR_PEP_ID=MMETSP1094-20130205/32314_1 /TAXON_ID=156173 /ORGANISM="Chrysochromulina brevifilum, Strain UTEX LB 985" /LENGTH=259 /DNA_ID=CAMNT_0015920305 /DNA_START=84 /DNA_END=863 /DNA_ORIENTATION=-